MNRENELVCVSDTLMVRAFLLAGSLRRRGVRASVVDPIRWATTDDASHFVVAFDVIGRERIRVLRQRFPYTPILSYSERPDDAAYSEQAGADVHCRYDVHEIARVIVGRSSGSPIGDSMVAAFEGVDRVSRPDLWAVPEIS